MAMIEADQDVLILKRASASRPSGSWNDDDFDVLADGAMVGRILPQPVGSPWMWTLAFGHHEDRTPTHGYAATREAAMAALPRVGDGSRFPRRSPRSLTCINEGSRNPAPVGPSHCGGYTSPDKWAFAGKSLKPKVWWSPSR
jgi:hypothetical protein